MQFVISTSVVALAEVGDKTQLLSLLLAARFRRPWPIVAGITLATLLNHAAAAWVGGMVQAALAPDALRLAVGASFLAVAAWTLIPDRTPDAERGAYRHGAFLATLILFFLAEIGDKTQIATIVLAARFDSLWMVVLATTLGMLVANAPVVLLGGAIADRLPLRVIRALAAAAFAVLGALVLLRG